MTPARVTSLEIYYAHYIEPERNAKTFGQKFRVLFKNDGIFKTLIIVGAIFTLIGFIGCMVQGTPLMNFTHTFGLFYSIGIIQVITGLVLYHIRRNNLMERVDPLIAASLGKDG